jgi:hypothetical protein
MQPTEVQVVPSPQCLAGLVQLLAVGGPFHLLTLGLYINPVLPTRSSLLADFTPATYTGSAPIAAEVFSSPFYDVDGSALSLGADASFVCTGGTPNETVYGYILTDAAVVNLIVAYAFQTPVGIARIGDACPVAPFLRYSGD